MTIAACYVSPEGVVLGADSTSTYANGGADHYFNNGQKLFQIGESASLGVATWGLGGLDVTSYRRLFALLADDLATTPPTNVKEAADRWVVQFWAAYTASLAPVKAEYDALALKGVHDPALPPDPAMRTETDEKRFAEIPEAFYVGFCLGGCVGNDRNPEAYAMDFNISQPSPTPDLLGRGAYLWGAPNMVMRQIRGYDLRLRDDILSSSSWTGTPADLDNILGQYAIGHSSTVPIREAIDFVYSCIFSTIKAIKFSSFSQICGGPIEIAVMTADRHFRWVRHKNLGSAIMEGEAA